MKQVELLNFMGTSLKKEFQNSGVLNPNDQASVQNYNKKMTSMCEVYTSNSFDLIGMTKGVDYRIDLIEKEQILSPEEITLLRNLVDTFQKNQSDTELMQEVNSLYQECINKNFEAKYPAYSSSISVAKYSLDYWNLELSNWEKLISDVCIDQTFPGVITPRVGAWADAGGVVLGALASYLEGNDPALIALDGFMVGVGASVGGIYGFMHAVNWTILHALIVM